MDNNQNDLVSPLVTHQIVNTRLKFTIYKKKSNDCQLKILIFYGARVTTNITNLIDGVNKRFSIISTVKSRINIAVWFCRLETRNSKLINSVNTRWDEMIFHSCFCLLIGTLLSGFPWKSHLPRLITFNRRLIKLSLIKGRALYYKNYNTSL